MENKERMITVSLATPSDARGVQEVFYKTWLDTYPNEELGITVEDIEDKYKDAFTEEALKKRVERITNLPENQTFLIAKDGQKVVGICRGERNPDSNKLAVIYVLPEFQGKGVGSTLWNQIKAVFDVSHDTVVNVATYNEKAIEFYKKLGFEDSGKRFLDDKVMKSGAVIPEMEMIIKGNKDK